ncbi:hypothetical protein [uncultured Gammaproteobacteria bacterium]|nr:hypothetical protein [uncultured Gammaproteobacteria bacterium]
MPNKALVRTQTTLRFVCAAQLGRYVQKTCGSYTVVKKGKISNIIHEQIKGRML